VAFGFHAGKADIITDMRNRVMGAQGPSTIGRGHWTCATAALALILVPQAWCGADFAAARPAVRVEYWQQRLADITSRLEQDKNLSAVKLVFLGDSITDFWTMADNPWFKGAKMGRKIWDESFDGQPPANLGLDLGISGDRTEHILYRLLPKEDGGLGELDRPALNPDFVIVLAGINNTWAGEEPMAESVLAGIRAIVEAVHRRKPGSTIVLQSLLPTSDEEKNRNVVVPVNRHLLDLSLSPENAGYLKYLDLYSAFVDSSGRQIAAFFCDGLHPNESGFRVWRDRLVPFLDHLRASRGTKSPRT
jgi:lysophospholipase L1-like esterase